VFRIQFPRPAPCGLHEGTDRLSIGIRVVEERSVILPVSRAQDPLRRTEGRR